MDKIKFLFPTWDDIIILNDGCCCSISMPAGTVDGTKLTIKIE